MELLQCSWIGEEMNITDKREIKKLLSLLNIKDVASELQIDSDTVSYKVNNNWEQYQLTKDEKEMLDNAYHTMGWNENTIKKSDIRKIVKEEIQKVLKEAIEPSEYLKQKFPEVIEYDRTPKLSNLNWTVLTNKQWTDEDAYEFQSAAGYSPMGYGGPYKFNEEIIDGGKFEYTWYCAASS